MTDVSTNERLRVSEDGTAGPYIRVSVDQLDGLRQLLDRHTIRYSVDEHAISLDGGPYIAIVDLGRKGDARAVQALLDGAES